MWIVGLSIDLGELQEQAPAMDTRLGALLPQIERALDRRKRHLRRLLRLHAATSLRLIPTIKRYRRRAVWPG